MSAPDQPSTPPAGDPGEVRSAGAQELWQQYLVLRASARRIAAAAALLAAVGGASALVRPLEYEASATVAVSAARLAEQPPGLVPTEAWVPLLTTAAVESAVVDAVKLPEVSSATKLRARMTVRALPLSNLIRIVARASSPESAARLANTYADRAVAAATRLGQADVDSVHAELRTMLEQADERLQAAERAYDEYRTQARFEILEREVEALGEQRAELQTVIVDLEAERARLVELETDLKRRERVTSLKQALVDDPVMREVAKAQGATALGLEVTREQSNPVFENLDEQVAQARAQVAYLERRRQRLAAATGLSGGQLDALTRLYGHESRLDRLSSERELARRTYEAIAARYQGARLAAVGRTPQLLVVDHAVPPDAPLGRFVAFRVVLGAALGAVVVSLAVLVRRLVRPGGRAPATATRP